MRMKTLQMKRARRAALLFLLLCVAGMTKALAQTEGALNGVFTINDSGGKVLFSQGNLQYIGNATTPYWKFADRQWNYLGSNGQGGTSQSANRDLFGYGTSGYNHGATAYQPWATSTTNSHYYAYGSDTYNLYDQTGQADWGYNAIRNGGNQENSGWRTLTMEEWVYVFDTRNTASGIRYAKGKVNDVCGVILLPDYWNADYYTLNSTNTAEANYTDNVISADIWTANLEANGAVFLPAAGRRQGTSTTNLGTTCYYWSSSYINSSQAYELFVSSSTLVSSDDGYRYYGRSVRLVRNISQTSHTIGVSKNPVDGGIVTGGGTFDVGQSCTVTATANDGYTFLYWTKNGNIVSTNSTYTFYVFGNMDLVANFMLGSNIDFADDNVKALCVANWDTNGDGELSYAEAATVTSLGYVFCNNSEITSFEELQYFIGLNSIGDYAFFNCTNLTGSLFIPYSVTTIGESAFYNCSGLTGNLYIPNSVTAIGGYAFCECFGFTGDLAIPNSVTFLGEGAFQDCYGLTGCLTIPSSVSTISDYTFAQCYNFSSMMVLSETPPMLGDYVFWDWNTSVPVYVPCGHEDAYSSMSWGGFSNFNGICGGTVTVAANPVDGGTVTGGGMYGAGETCTVTATANDGYVFANWTKNGTIVSENISYTFYVTENSNLAANFVLEGNIVFADDNVKALCVANWDTNGDGELSYAEAAAVTDLGGVFSYNTDITSFEELQYFVGLSYIGDEEFFQCTGLTSIIIPNFVTRIGDQAFYACFSITDLTIPSSVASISDLAFLGCIGVEHIMVASDNTYFDSRESCNAIIRTADNTLVFGCKNTVIPNTVVSIGDYAFSSCTGLTSIGIPNSVTSIGDYAFSSCTGLTSIGIPNSVTTIGNNAFYNCYGLNGSLTIGNSVETIGNNAFYNCYNLTGDLVIPNSVTSIGNNAFYNCYGLDGNLTIGNSVETIGNYAFYNCYGLTGDLIIPNSVTTIGYNAFYNCAGLDGVLTIGNSVTSIGDHAFYWCTGLTGDLVIPNSVTSIGTYAFGFCNGLTEIWCKSATPPTISDNLFYFMAESKPVYVPCGALSNYQSADYWSEFTDYSEYSNVLVVRPNDNSIGSASITQNASCSDNECTVHAEAYSGGAFVNWTTPNGMEISTEADYTFNLTEDVILVANFNRLPNHYVFVGGGSTWYWNDVDNWDTGELPNATSTVTVMSEPNVNEDVTVASMTVCNDSWVYVYDNASLTVTGTLNTIGSSTISVDEGSQLYHANDGVKVRAYKTISPYTEGESDGWHLIASPIANDVAISSMWILTSGKYDLYYYDEPTHYWMNQKQTENHFDALENTKGYLYGNEGTIWTTGYSPLNTYYGYSISECLFRASELEAAGLSGTLTSLSWYANNSTGAEQSNISIWMANVSDTQLTSTSHNTSSMTLVYTGSMTPVIGWNEFAFNEGSFTWDGTSNVIVCVQRNKGAIGSEIQWRCNSNDLGFVAVTYNGNNTTPYDMESNTYSVSTSSYYRPDIIFRTATTNAQIVNSVTPKNLSFSGTAKDGTAKINIPLSYASADGKLKGFNLIGNPFVHNVTSFASTNVAEECYRMNDTKDNLIVSEVSTSKPLKPAEGFFVKATAEGASITFNNGAKGETTRSGRINLELGENGKLIDRFIVKQEGEPLEKMSLKENGTRIFASNGNQEMAVVTAEGEEQAVSFKAAKNGTYTLSANVENMSVDYLHLIDNLTGTDVNLLVSPEYTFNAKTTDYTSRFRLVFRENSGSSTSAEYFAFISNGEIVLTDAEAGATLQIVDVIGRIIVSKDAARRVSTAGIPAGVYVLRLINGNDVKTQKIVIE